VPAVTDAACLGAALLAGTATGLYADLATAVLHTVRWRSQILPDPVAVAAYDARHTLFRQAYPLLADLLHVI